MGTSPSDIRKEILAGGSLPGEYSLGPSSGSLVGSPRVTSIVFTPWLTKNELKLALLMPHDYVLFPISFSIVLAVAWNRRSVVCNVILCRKVTLSPPNRKNVTWTKRCGKHQRWAKIHVVSTSFSNFSVFFEVSRTPVTGKTDSWLLKQSTKVGTFEASWCIFYRPLHSPPLYIVLE